ncbi:S1 family peptidase [Streptomyces sp. NPDC003691]
MNHRRIPKRKAVIAAAGAAGIVAAAVVLPQAYASHDGTAAEPRPRTLSAESAAVLARQLGDRLGASYAGGYYDAGKQRLVVNVAGGGPAARDRVRAAGAVPRTVRNTTRTLLAAQTALGRRAPVPGSAWAVDPRTNRVLVTADRTVTGADWDRLTAAVGALGSGVARIGRSAGEFRPYLAGGDAIFAGGARCSAGFNVTTGDGRPGFLTAGHCAVAADRWSDRPGGPPVGTVARAVFPGDGDLALVTYDDPAAAAPGVVDTGGGRNLTVTGAADAAVG